jgi:hypothetical protein
MTNNEAWHRRHAIHIVSELPDDYQDAIAVLRLAIEVVEKFLIPDVPQPAREAVFLLSAARKRSLKETGKPASSPS